MNISFLADHPEFIQTLAPWIVEHWRLILTQETIETRTATLQKHLNYRALPVAWVAHSGAQVFGTAALRVHDLPGHEHLTPWLGGVFVAPQFRQQGIGTALCLAVERQAQVLFGFEKLYLFTLDRQAWYRSLGWHLFEPCTWCGLDGHVMIKKFPV